MQENQTYTVTEKIVMLKISQLNHQALTMTLDDLANEMTVSTATINRTLKKMGYDNLKQYKSSLNNPSPQTNSETTVIEDNIITLINNFDKKLLHTATSDINNASNIYIVAFGLSTSLGLEMSINFRKLGKNTIYINDSEALNLINHNTLNRNDIIIYISYSGADPDMLNFSLLNRFKVGQILITSTSDCPLATNCNYTLSSNVDKVNDPFKSRIPLNLITYKIIALYFKLYG